MNKVAQGAESIISRAGNTLLTLGRDSRLPVILLIALVAIIYATLFMVYRPMNIDNPWFLSFSYNLCEKGVSADTLTGDTFPQGMGGTVAFGSVPARLQCALLSVLGWSYQSGLFISILALSLVMAVIWLYLAGKHDFSRLDALSVVLALMCVEPFFGMANTTRYDVFVLLFSALALLLFQRRLVFLSVLSAMLAIEAHPAGAAAFIYIAASFLSDRQGLSMKRHIPEAVIALALGTGLYWYLHGNPLEMAMRMASGSDRPLGGNFLYIYFFRTKGMRHLPELLVVLLALALHIKNRDYRSWAFPLAASMGCLVAGFFLGWTNFYYTPYWYLPTLLLVFFSLRRYINTRLLALALALYFVPIYGYACMKNHAYRDMSFLYQANEIVRADAGGEDYSVFGNRIFWLPFRHSGFYSTTRAGADGLIRPRGISESARAFIICAESGDEPADVPCRLIDEAAMGAKLSIVKWDGMSFTIYRAAH